MTVESDLSAALRAAFLARPACAAKDNPGLTAHCDAIANALLQSMGVLASAAPQTIGTSNVLGTGTTAARDNHVHAHGSQTDPTLHAAATQSVAGFMPPGDKTKVDRIASPVADLTALHELAVDGFGEGTACYVISVADWYIFDTVARTPDGLNVVEASNGDFWVARTVGRWDDVAPSVLSGKNTAALVQEAYRDTPAQMLFFQHNTNEDITLVFQMPHRWRRDTKVFPHLHWVPMVNPATTEVVHFDGYWAWSEIGGELPALTGWTSFSVTVNVGTSDAFKQKITELVPAGVTPPTGAKESTCLVVYLRRNTGTSDTYTTSKASGTAQANVCLVSVDAHYQSDKMGTETEVPA